MNKYSQLSENQKQIVTQFTFDELNQLMEEGFLEMEDKSSANMRKLAIEVAEYLDYFVPEDGLLRVYRDGVITRLQH